MKSLLIVTVVAAMMSVAFGEEVKVEAKAEAPKVEEAKVEAAVPADTTKVEESKKEEAKPAEIKTEVPKVE